MKKWPAAMTAALICGLGIFLICHAANSPAPAESDVAPLKHLNENISNGMSDIPELEGLDRKVLSYMAKWEMKGASLAITRGDSLVYAKGYGKADEGVDMEPGHILRMASVSKLITAVGIMVLRDQGLLSLDDKIFGPSGILDDSLSRKVIRDTAHFHHITVEHLLRHQAGFYRDPVFASRDVRNEMLLDHTPTAEDFKKLVLSHSLRWEPGEWQKYSNFGFMLLSEVIEKIGGVPYENFIADNVLSPAGCFDMHIAGNYYADKRENEVRYYTHNGDGKFIEDFSGSGKMVERSYGGNNVTLLSGAGAWCGSTVELARLVASIDKDPACPDILSAEAIDRMTEYFDENTYSLGWNDTAPGKGWTRTGTFSGTSALIKRFPDGECWIFISNTSTYRGPAQARYTAELFDVCRSLYSGSLPHRDMFTE